MLRVPDIDAVELPLRVPELLEVGEALGVCVTDPLMVIDGVRLGDIDLLCDELGVAVALGVSD